MNNAVEEITKLTEEWYKLIGGDHHKDRDCHWYIETKWSYGDHPKYIVRHYGYILDEVQIESSTYDQALICLKATLEESIECEKKVKDQIDFI